MSKGIFIKVDEDFHAKIKNLAKTKRTTITQLLIQTVVEKYPELEYKDEKGT